MKSLVGLVALLATLCSCTPAQMSPGAQQGDEFASALERYENLGEDEASYTLALTGSALAAAIESQALLDSLDYQRLGKAKFEVISSSQSTATACMDLREVQVLDAAGFPVKNSLDRGTVLVELEDGLISKFELLGNRC
jgi:hypothetical protein